MRAAKVAETEVKEVKAQVGSRPEAADFVAWHEAEEKEPSGVHGVLMCGERE